MAPHQRQGDARRSAIMAFLRLHQAQYGFAPSMAEIGEAVGLRSLNATRNHLLWLQEDGFIDVTPGFARAIRLVDPAPDGWSTARRRAS